MGLKTIFRNAEKPQKFSVEISNRGLLWGFLTGFIDCVTHEIPKKLIFDNLAKDFSRISLTMDH